ncbi:unnamed protein product [Choristocarpus tenellus]
MLLYLDPLNKVRERMLQGLPPESAEEYLLRVRIESRELPDVVEAFVPESLKKKQVRTSLHRGDIRTNCQE